MAQTMTLAYPVTLWRGNIPVHVKAGTPVVVPDDEAHEVRPRGVPIVHLALWSRVCGPVLASALVPSENGAHPVG